MALAEPNPYNLDIETKRKKHHLAHELGAGLPCNKCMNACPGFDLHFWRKICKNCHCGHEEHGVVEGHDVEIKRFKKLFGAELSNKIVDQHITDQMNKNLSISNNKISSSANGNKNEPIEWLHSQTNSTSTNNCMDNLRKNSYLASEGQNASDRKRLLKVQLPIHDLDPSYCHELSGKEIQKMNEFIEKCKKCVSIGLPKEHIMESPLNCRSCSGKIPKNEVYVYIEQLPEKYWHLKCFCCHACKNRLVDLICFSEDGSIYCGRHFAELQFCRCSACDELIFTESYTKAEAKNWHIKHFCCFKCDKPLAGMSYAPSQDGFPHCISCISEKCASCMDLIPVNGKRISLNNCHWHAEPQCFKCSNCQKSLLGQKFLVKDNYIFCSASCKKTKSPA